METFSFIARMPDEPGKLHAAARVIAEHGGNIRRVSFERNIDPMTVFFEVSSSAGDYQRIMDCLEELGFLQTELKQANYLKFDIYLSHRTGAFYDFLRHTTSAGANIAFLDFDDRGSHPDRLTVGLTLEDNARVETLLDSLKSLYRMEILEYDASGKHLDETVFYVRFAGELREILGDKEDAFLLKLLHDINHAAQELSAGGQDPKQAFESILSTGRTLKQTTGRGFYADVQKIAVTPDTTLFCFQMPCGGNIYLFDARGEKVMIDTGYGIYQRDVRQMLQKYLPGNTPISRIYVTHADTDHAGALGHYGCPAYMHPGTLDIIKKNNRAYLSKTEKNVLEEIYTKLINLFSENTEPGKPILFKDKKTGLRGIFPLIDRFVIGDLSFCVLESLGGHMHAQTFFLCEEHKLLFTGDSLMPFESLTDERKKYNLHAKNLMTTVNVDSKAAGTERKALLDHASGIEGCVICPGHGALSKIKNGKLETYGAIERYAPGV